MTNDLCINVPKPNYSIYAYCDDTFSEFKKKILCKLDTCRVCCVTSDQIWNVTGQLDELNICFHQCSITFDENPSRENS